MSNAEIHTLRRRAIGKQDLTTTTYPTPHPATVYPSIGGNSDGKNHARLIFEVKSLPTPKHPSWPSVTLDIRLPRSSEFLFGMFKLKYFMPLKMMKFEIVERFSQGWSFHFEENQEAFRFYLLVNDVDMKAIMQYSVAVSLSLLFPSVVNTHWAYKFRILMLVPLSLPLTKKKSRCIVSCLLKNI